MELSFHAASGKSADEMFLQGEEERHDGDGDEDGAGREEAVLRGLSADVLFECDGEGVSQFAVHEGGGEDEFVPGGHEAEECGDRDSGAREWENDRDENFESRGAIDDGGFFEFFGYGIEVAFEVPDAEGESGDAIDEDESRDAI